jgi:hypothetical protein
MNKKKIYLTLDTETCTLPFIGKMKLTEKEKQAIAISKPIIYDIGWVLSDTKGNVLLEKNFLVEEVFFCSELFDTAYYKNKRPLYIEMYRKNEIEVQKWEYIVNELLLDLQGVTAITAYNACFDFKKALPFTERFFKAFYSDSYEKWLEGEKVSATNILLKNADTKNPNYLNPVFNLRGTNTPIIDLWSVACQRLINNRRYKKFCVENELFTNSLQYFSTSAESVFRYLIQDYNFVEDHTALSDAQIEKEILCKMLKKGKIEPTIVAFPFRELGTIVQYVQECKNSKNQFCEFLTDKLIELWECDKTDDKTIKKLEKMLEKIEK